MLLKSFVCIFLCCFVILNVFEINNARNLAKPCQVRLICSEEDEEITYATEGEQCHVFSNACELRNENCVRHNFFFKTLEPLSPKECQKMCTGDCLEETEKVCSEYKGVKRTFSSYCAWNFHICTTGEMYSKPTQGECPSD